MPLPHKFLIRASAAAHVPQLLATASRNRRLEAGVAGIAQLLGRNWGARFYMVRRRSTDEESEVYFRAAQKEAKKNHIQLNALADAVTELHYRRWLRETHSLDLTPPADSTPDALNTHLETVKQFLSNEVVKELDYRVESAVYPTECEVESMMKDIKQTARDILVIVHASSNRRITSGGTPVPSLFTLAPLAGRRLKLQKGKETLKIVWIPPTFEDLGIHNALRRSAARQYQLQLEFEYILHRCGLAPLPTPLRTNDAAFIHNFRPHFQWNGSPSLAIPKVKQGTPRLWFQGKIEPEDNMNMNLGKNVLQLHPSKADVKLRTLVKKRDTVKIFWYHKEEGARTDGPSHNYRRYASKKAWEEAHATKANLRDLEFEFRESAASPRDSLYSPRLPRIVKQPVYTTDSLDGPRLPRIIKQPVNIPSPLVRRSFYGDNHSLQGGNGGGIEDGTSQRAPPSTANPPESNEVYRRPPSRSLVRYHLSVRPEQPQTHIRALWEARNMLDNTSAGQTRMYSTARVHVDRPRSGTSKNEYNLNFGDTSSYKRVHLGDSRVRQRLRAQEVQRKDSLAAIRQGKEFHVAGVGEPSEDMMEEADFVKALTELSTTTVEDITETSGMEFMDIGDLIELRSFGGGSELGIFIQPPLQKNGNFLFLTESGRIKTWPTTGMVFTIPKFASTESAELLRKYLSQISADNDAFMLDPPRHLTKPLTDKIREFQKNALNVFSSKLPIMEQLYAKFSHETESRVISTHEAAKVIFPGGYENHQFYALHLALMGDPRHFIADSGRNHKKTTEFEVRSRKQLEVLRTVTEWLRRKAVTLATGKVAKKHSDVINSFAEKAAALIDKSRELRGDQEGLFKPVEQIPMTEFAWDENDKAIIEFLKCSLNLYWFQISPFAPHYPQVLKATGRYKEEWKLDLDLLYIFLMEIGVYRPWENRYRFNQRMPLPYHGLSGEADALADKVAEMDKDAEAAWQRLGLKDKMELFREDITETIYAIDDPSAEEIDDGISLTPVSETESWVHVHVANPTAFLEPDHWIAEMAREKFQTIYLPEKTFGMIPRGLVDYRWGLASNRPTLTISAKVNNQSGEVLDYKIRFGNAKNVKRLTYANFNTILGQKPTAKPFTLVINPPRDPITGDIIETTTPNPVVQVSPEEEAVLKQLRGIAVALKKKRVASGCLSFLNESFRVSAKDHPLDPNSSNRVDINPDLPILHKGLPTVTFTRELPPTAAHETVAEFMLLGGTMVSRFLSTHKIPAPFRAHSIVPRQGAAEIWENILLVQRNEMGLIHKDILRDHFNILGSTRLQARAESHQLLGIRTDPESGIGGYTKATSPLRRYLDMVVHFQLQQAIRNLREGLPAIQNLPYSQAYLERTLPRALTKERTIRDFQQAADRFWVWKVIRWGTLESKVVPGREHLMPKQYTMELTSKNQYLQASMGLVKEFGVVMKCWFNDEATYEAAEWGCIGNVQVDESMWSRVKINMRWIKKHQ